MVHHDDTTAVHGGRPAQTPDGPVNPPISLSSTLHAGGPHGYGREHNDTLAALEIPKSELQAALARTDTLPGVHVIVATTGSRQAEAALLRRVAAAVQS